MSSIRSNLLERSSLDEIFDTSRLPGVSHPIYPAQSEHCSRAQSDEGPAHVSSTGLAARTVRRTQRTRFRSCAVATALLSCYLETVTWSFAADDRKCS